MPGSVSLGGWSTSRDYTLLGGKVTCNAIMGHHSCTGNHYRPNKPKPGILITRTSDS